MTPEIGFRAQGPAAWSYWWWSALTA